MNSKKGFSIRARDGLLELEITENDDGSYTGILTGVLPGLAQVIPPDQAGKTPLMNEKYFGPEEVSGDSEDDVLQKVKAIIKEKAGHVIDIKPK